MTMRERMLALAQGRPHDRVPFVQYSGLAAPNEAIWSVIGRGNMGLLVWTCVHALDTPNCRFVREDIVRDGRPGFRNTLITPEGRLYEERLIEPAYGTSAAACHYVKEPDDYRILMAYFRDMRVRLDCEGLYRVVRDLGDDGLPHVSVARTPYQQLWVQWVCLADLGIHLAEWPDLMQEVVSEIERVQHGIFRVVCEAVRSGAPVPYVVFPDNITAPAIGDTYFRRYCVRAYDELAGLLAETGRDVPLFVHADGDLKALWRAIAESPLRGLDSMSPPPDNDTSVAEAVAQWPEMRLCVNFPSSVHLAGPDAIRLCTEKLLEEGGRTGRLQIQISENVPADVWRVSFPAIASTIAAFGAKGMRAARNT
ncbi:MAG TPA: hypothetical protein P5318_04475 [Candidatus Hydrogenedentes bacterium]|nr:hypothetical protein [Candidatus Hydrogenedentota bacterium]HPC15542.1 hypothetical protein [Candidatus Hydrogenedentota bacterium]HRT19362.1 hypothetical protein [Candidatus Hydrogenedentota bacterium]HRT63904.1 hypothetical protein [Candidatus Hydrogenedentota bacterium]